MIAAYALIALVGGAASVFVLQNLDPVAVRFLAWKDPGIPLALVLLLGIAAGAFLATLIGLVRGATQAAHARRLAESCSFPRFPRGGPVCSDYPPRRRAAIARRHSQARFL